MAHVACCRRLDDIGLGDDDGERGRFGAVCCFGLGRLGLGGSLCRLRGIGDDGGERGRFEAARCLGLGL